jgi:hypothetical protein
MRVPANVPYVFLSVRVSNCWLRSSLCISLCGLSHKSSMAFLLTELFISVDLSRLHCLHHGCASYLWTLIALYAAFTFCVSKHHRSILSAKIFWKRNLGKP